MEGYVVKTGLHVVKVAIHVVIVKLWKGIYVIIFINSGIFN